MTDRAVARFELIGELYYAATGRLRPGKSEPLATGRDANSNENRARFDEWLATKGWSALIDHAIRTQERLDEALSKLEEIKDGTD